MAIERTNLKYLPLSTNQSSDLVSLPNENINNTKGINADNPNLDARGNASSLALRDPNLDKNQSAISPYAEAAQDLEKPVDLENLNLDPKASNLWLTAVNFLKGSATKVFNTGYNVVSDIVPASTYALNEAATNKKANNLLTHATIGGAGLLALSSASDFINVFKSVFKWQDRAVPSAVDAVNGLAKVGLAGTVVSKAISGDPLKKEELAYSAAGLLLLKLVMDAMKGVGPLASTPGVKDLVQFTQESLKALGQGAASAGAETAAG